MSRAMREFSKQLLEKRVNEQLHPQPKIKTQDLLDALEQINSIRVEPIEIHSCYDFGMCRICGVAKNCPERERRSDG